MPNHVLAYSMMQEPSYAFFPSRIRCEFSQTVNGQSPLYRIQKTDATRATAPIAIRTACPVSRWVRIRYDDTKEVNTKRRNVVVWAIRHHLDLGIIERAMRDAGSRKYLPAL